MTRLTRDPEIRELMERVTDRCSAISIREHGRFRWLPTAGRLLMEAAILWGVFGSASFAVFLAAFFLAAGLEMSALSTSLLIDRVRQLEHVAARLQARDSIRQRHKDAGVFAFPDRPAFPKSEARF